MDSTTAPACREHETRIEELTARILELEQEYAKLHQLQETMHRNTALFEALVANSPDGIALTGPDRRIVRIVKGLTGLDPRSLGGALIELVAVPEDREAIIDAYKRLLHRECTRVEFEMRAGRADGSTMWLSVTLTDMLDNPNVQGVVWNYADITRQKELEQALGTVGLSR